MRTSTRPNAGAFAQRLEPPLLTHRLRDFEQLPIAALIRRAGRALHDQCRQEQQRCRVFAERHVWPLAEQWDQRIARDPELVDWPAIDAGVEHGMLSSVIPQRLGGRGAGPLAQVFRAEELAAADAGVCALFGAHDLALATLAAGARSELARRVMTEVSHGERRGEPVLLALAHDEGARVERVSGGYRLDASEALVDNGAIARYVVFTARGAAERSVAQLLVPGDAPGLSVAGVPRKLGLRSCPSAELVACDVLVPRQQACLLDDDGPGCDRVQSVARGWLAAMSTGIARGALERSLKYLAQRRAGARWLFEEPWVQLALADMLGLIQAGRGLYVDAALALERASTRPRLLARSRWRGALRPTPRPPSCLAIASAAKRLCSDAAVKVCTTAMDILGQDANDPRWGVEKCLRDARHVQSAEGVLERLDVARGLLERR